MSKSPDNAMIRRWNDPEVVKEQYRDSSNLTARANLHERFGTGRVKWFEWYFDQLDLPPAARVLELGCGLGKLWDENRARIPAGWELALTDLSFGMIETTRATGVHARLVQSDAQAIPFPDGYFDAVIANHMLYHVPDLAQALSDIRRVLKRSGTLYAATNGLQHMVEVKEMLNWLFQIDEPAATLPFNLENGGEWLSQYCNSIHCIDHSSPLVVTEPEPLVDYIFSMRLAHGRGTPEHRERLTRHIAEQIARDGAVRITRAVGLFEARNS